ncbi:hypothetical protein BJ322DRAFT_558728 [Thelephora terrestris]|uniref:Uncharacterized protein n=1 Tax=Thelephora terrestris TaxID=56493 RepID=A0A9P6LAY0_9AGAM|nr:hypothetical protein BJ322DRAFT_558728 [Thelephora terrestris]
MNTTMISKKLFQRPFYTATARALQLQAKPQRFGSPLAAVSIFQHRRSVASSVGSRPASQNLKHAALNIREEVGNSAADAARSIAGGNLATDYLPPGKNSSFIGVTKTIAGAVPTPYLVFGLAGALPYLGTSATVIYLANQASLAAQGVLSNIDPGVALTLLDRALSIQVTYGAVMLSFLGALHWGMEFSGLGGYHGYRRLMLGAVPIIVAWPTLAMGPTTALMVQWLGFTGLWYADVKATAAGWAPKWYSQYRFYLSLLVGTCIIGTLAGISYYGPVAGHGLLSHDLQMIQNERRRRRPETSGTVSGDIEAVSTGETGDSYVQIRKKHKPEEEDKE